MPPSVCLLAGEQGVHLGLALSCKREHGTGKELLQVGRLVGRRAKTRSQVDRSGTGGSRLRCEDRVKRRLRGGNPGSWPGI